MTTTNGINPTIVPDNSIKISTFEKTKEALTAFACLTFFPVLYLIGNFIFN